MKYSLPDSATDLLIKDGKLLMRSLTIYEVLRRFGHILRLTAYRFEDFTAALLAEDQSALLAEIHIQLLRTLVREDRQQQTWLGPPDIRDPVNLYVHMLDHSNWPAVLDIYLSADPKRNAHILEILDGDERGCYPFSSTLETRLFILEELCDRLLLSVLARDDIVGGGTSTVDKIDKNCRICAKATGDLTSCKVCLGNFHPKCSNQSIEKPPDKDELADESCSSENGVNAQTCRICRDNHVRGVTDCTSEEERLGNLKRHEALGYDKLGRRYWFVTRRLFVVDETEDDVRYYTNISQFREIIESLNENRHEKGLIENLIGQQAEIERQMQITQDLYSTLMKDHKNDDGSYALHLGQNGLHRSYTNNFPAILPNKLQSYDRDIIRNLNNKFCMTNQLKWFGAINGHLNTISLTVRTSILKFEAQLPSTFVHPCWPAQRPAWIKTVNQAKNPVEFARALTKLETCIKPVLFKSAWYDSVGFLHLFRSTYLEREEMKKNDRQPRGFERNERTTADFELSYRLGTMVKFSPKLKPVKHQVWKQKGEEYRLTGLNGWYWHGTTRRSRCLAKPKLYRNDSYRWSQSTTNHPFVQDMVNERIKSQDVIDISYDLSQDDEQHRILYAKIPTYSSHRRARVDKIEGLLKRKLDALQKVKQEALNEQTPNINGTGAGGDSKSITHMTNGVSTTPIKTENGCTNPTIKGANVNRASLDIKNVITLVSSKSSVIKPRLPPSHDFLTKLGKVRSVFVLPDLELRRLARSGGQKEARTFSYTAKPNFYVWPYGITPRPTFRTCWLYRNELSHTVQEIALHLKVLNACIRWDDLQTKPPAGGHNIITLDDATVTIELLKKRDKLPYMTHSEYLIRKTTAPVEQPTKYRKIGTKKSTPSARSGLRARRQVEEEEEKGPTREEIWVSEYQLELWELKQFDEKLERQTALIRERAQREEADRRRRQEEEKRRAADQEKRRLKAQAEGAYKRARTSAPLLTYQNSKSATSATPPQTPPNRVGAANNSINIPQQGSQSPATPVLRYFRTEQGQIIRLPASYLQRGTPLILRHVTPGTNQTNTYIIRPQASPATGAGNNAGGMRLLAPATLMMQTQVQPLLTTPSQTAPLLAGAAIPQSQQQQQPLLTFTPATQPMSPAQAPQVGIATTAIRPQVGLLQPPPILARASVSRVGSVMQPAPTAGLTLRAMATVHQPQSTAPGTTRSADAHTLAPIDVKPLISRVAAVPAAASTTGSISNHMATITTTATTSGLEPTTAAATTSTTIAASATGDLEAETKAVLSEIVSAVVVGAGESKSGNENETNGAEWRAGMSVGTVANEMAHDQHAPSPLVNAAGVTQREVEAE